MYYSNLAGQLPGTPPSGAPYQIAVSHTDDLRAAAAGTASAWSAPVIASGPGGANYVDKAQIWADNAASSRHFGTVYACYDGYPDGTAAPTWQALYVATSHDGGVTWRQQRITPSVYTAGSRTGLGYAGRMVRTDSRGTAYVFALKFGAGSTGAAAGRIEMIKSFDGGRHWLPARRGLVAYDTCNAYEPSIGHCVGDGVGGRSPRRSGRRRWARATTGSGSASRCTPTPAATGSARSPRSTAVSPPLTTPPPPVQTVCPPTFGNTDIYAGAFPNDYHP